MAQPNLNPNSPFFHEERHSSLALFAGKPITICGVGALGGNLAETLARMGFTNLKLVDRDRVELRNLSTQPYSRAEIGSPKARALANMLYRAVQAKLEPVVVELAEANAVPLLKESALVVDALDNRAGRSAVSSVAQSLELPCLHIGFSADGLYGSGLWEPGYKIPQDTQGDPCDYPLTRPLALTMAALAARIISQFFTNGQKTEFELTWNDLKINYYPHE
ncbi:MAG: ThiF family adenylyltransferase [Chloroflexi bacterium]|nr:ThiF family adenylyltransferase [Chloroflexota bacterium]